VLERRQVDDPEAPGGKRGKRLSDFMEHEVARFCELTEVEVFALRFYTTAGFKGINWQDFCFIKCYFWIKNKYRRKVLYIVALFGT
jgi:hypothetical protein